MITPYVIALGTGEVSRRQLGPKGRFLDVALRKGLPVPPGVVVLEEAWQALEQRAFISELDVAPSENTTELINLLQERGLFAPWVVRSCFDVEDSPVSSFAGMFASVLHVTHDNLEAAISEVLESASHYKQLPHAKAHLRRDVLIMPQVSAQHAGVAFSDPDYEDDWLNVSEGFADKLLAGQERGEQYALARLRFFEKASSDDWQARVQHLLRRVRQVFGDKPWDVEWADDGEQCYLLQVRPITRAVRRNDVFTIANHKEILPQLPSRFMASVIEACAPDLFAYYRAFDRTLPRARHFIELFRWRPYINLSLMTDMMRHFGLPTRLVTDSIGGSLSDDVGARPLRMLRKVGVLLRLGLAQMFSVPSSQHTRRVLLTKTAKYAAFVTDASTKASTKASTEVTFREVVEVLEQTYSHLVREMFSLTAATSAPVFLLRRLGSLSLHAASQRTIGTEMLTDLNPLKALVAEHPEWHATLLRGNLPEDDTPKVNTSKVNTSKVNTLQKMWQAYLDKHGHRGIFESDIARPRLREDPAPMLRTLLQPPLGEGNPTRKWRWQSAWRVLLTLPLWWQAKGAIAARERLRFDAMRAFERLRLTLLALADEAVTRGQLPERDAIWQLSVAEVLELDLGKCFDKSFMQARQAEIDALSSMNLPDLLRRFDDLEQYTPAHTRNHLHFHGISLTEGSVRGKAWRLREPESRLPRGFSPENTILVAPSIDSGWLATFNLVAGVVVETGGDLSHGSIILRELGLPAITNVSGVMQALQTGDVLVMNARDGNVERLEATALHDDVSLLT